MPVSSVSKVRKAQGRGKLGGCMIVGFFLVFAAAGTAMAYWLSWKPWSGLVAARSWTSVPCTILTSEVETSSSSDGDTYRIAITYEYEYAGVGYEGDRYNFSFGSSSGYEGKAKVVAQYPPDSQAECFVDPDDPSQSVINRSPGLYLLWTLFPLPFLAVGYGGILGMLFFRGDSREKRKAAGARGRSPRHEPEPAHAAGQLVLEPKLTPLGKLVGTTLIALFWNGIVGVFLFFMIQAWRDGDREVGCALLFLVPFVLIGIALIVGIFYQLLALANPRPHLVLETSRVEPGRPCSMSFHFTGSVSRLREVTIEVEGRESATYRRGTSSVTDHETFYKEVLLKTQGPGGHRRTMTLTLPERTMPTFEADHNKIEWRITIHGDIPRWPDVSEEFPITVYPPGGAS